MQKLILSVKMRLAVLLSVVLSIVSCTTFESFYEGYKVYRVSPQTEEQIEILRQLQNYEQLDFWTEINNYGKPVDVMISPNDQENIIQVLIINNIPYETLIDNVQRILENEHKAQVSAPRTPEGRISFTKFNTYKEINAYTKKLAQDHSDIVSIELAGHSTEGRELNVIKISKNPSAKNPVIFLDGGIHAREWLAPAQTTYIIHQLVEQAANSHLLDKVDWHILPVVNPDGYEFTHSAIRNRLWRKTRSLGKSCYGTDANRNFAYYWAVAGSSNSECSDIYHGPKALSEPESLALANYLDKYKDTIKLYISFHSYGNYLLYPWGYTTQLPSDWRELQSLAENVANAIRKVSGTSYTIGSSSNALYPAAGGSDDYAKGVSKIELAYTIELSAGGSTGFDPPASKILPFVSETWQGIIAYHEYIASKFG